MMTKRYLGINPDNLIPNVGFEKCGQKDKVDILVFLTYDSAVQFER